MDHFLYRNGALHVEDVPLGDIAAAVGTPVYVYSAATLTRHYRVFEAALAGMPHLICYAVKANSNLAVLALMAGLGAGMDVVSRANSAARAPPACPASGSCSPASARPRAEIALALDPTASARSTSKSEPELERARRGRRRARRARADRASGSTRTWTRGTHAKIATGSAENKFGVPIADARRRSTPRPRALPGIEAGGRRLPHRQPDHRPRALSSRLRARSPTWSRRCAPTATTVDRLDLGGGLGIPYLDAARGAAAPFDYGDGDPRDRRPSRRAS